MTDVPPELTQSLASLHRRIADVRDFQIPRLESLSTGGIERHSDLCSELRTDLDAIARAAESLAELGEEQVSEADRSRARVVVADIEEQIARLRQGYRRAALTSRALIKTNVSQTQHELLSRAGSTSSALPVATAVQARGQNASRGDGGDDALQTKTNEVTDALRRTTALMQSELERSVLSVQILDESTQTIRATQTLYSRYESLLSTSSKLVKQLERADWYDRIIIISALLFFLLVVGFIVKRRVLDKAARGVGWWVGGSFKLVGMGLGQLVPGKRIAAKVDNVENRVQTKLADVLDSAVPAVDTEVKPVQSTAAEPSVPSVNNLPLVIDTTIPVAAATVQSKDEL